ncbi:hypothetical protein JOD24_000452 [Kroppenstedtia sanguinis]
MIETYAKTRPALLRPGFHNPWVSGSPQGEQRYSQPQGKGVGQAGNQNCLLKRQSFDGGEQAC